MKYRMVISYDGRGFSGWQVQPGSLTIQGTLEEALHLLTHERVRVVGSGRTDTGVHAVGQSAHFILEKELPPAHLELRLNGMLPPAIRIRELEGVPFSFHAQRSALSKTYHYHLWLERVISPFLAPYRFHVRRPLDIELLKAAAALFVQRTDFATFANVGVPVRSTVRTLLRLDVIEQEGGVRLEFEGEGFLYKMVRNITGTLLAVAMGKLSIDEIPRLLAAKDRRAAGMAAPAHGLFLMEVRYPEELLVKDREQTRERQEA